MLICDEVWQYKGWGFEFPMEICRMKSFQIAKPIVSKEDITNTIYLFFIISIYMISNEFSRNGSQEYP